MSGESRTAEALALFHALNNMLLDMIDIAVTRHELTFAVTSALRFVNEIPRMYLRILELFSVPDERAEIIQGISPLLQEVPVVFQEILDRRTVSVEAIITFRNLYLLLLEIFSFTFIELLQYASFSDTTAPEFEDTISVLENFFPVHDERLESMIGVIPEVENFPTLKMDQDIETYTLQYIYLKPEICKGKEKISEDCAICLYSLEEGQQARRLPCFHLFHKECSDKWLMANNICPLCRLEIGNQQDGNPLTFRECCDDFVE